MIRNTQRGSMKMGRISQVASDGGYRPELPGRGEKTMVPKENSARHRSAGAVDRESV